MIPEETKSVTDAQRKEISKILFKGKLALVGIMAKYAIGLFGANLFAILIEVKMLSDVDPEQQVYFQIIAMLINFIFMAMYLNRQLVANRDSIQSKIKEVFSQKQ